MKGWKSVFFLLIAGINFQVYAVAANNPQPMGGQVRTNQEIIEEIKRLEKGIASFKCDFVMQIFMEGQTDPEKEEGNIAFKTPSFWRLEQYKAGEKTPFFSAGCNGKTLWKSDKEDTYPDVVAKVDVENISTDQRNGLMLQTATLSPFFLLSEGLMSDITSVTDGQDNTWVFEISTDEPISPRIPFKISKLRFEVSKETGLIKSSEYFTEGRLLVSIKFKYTKLDSALIAQ